MSTSAPSHVPAAVPSDAELLTTVAALAGLWDGPLLSRLIKCVCTSCCKIDAAERSKRLELELAAFLHERRMLRETQVPPAGLDDWAAAVPDVLLVAAIKACARRYGGSVALDAGALGSALLAGFEAGRNSMELALAVAERARDTARAEAEAARRQACTDPLTGLANRAGLDAEFARRTTANESWVFALVDLDDFKRLNGSYGYLAGDAVLVDVARRLTASTMQPGSLVARLGGDEFVVAADGELPWTIADHVQSALSRPFLIADLQVTVTASIGLVQVLPGDSPRSALHSADIALRSAKRNGKARTAEFNPCKDLADVAAERPAERARDRLHRGRSAQEAQR